MKDHSVALLVHASDRYQLLYPGFEHYFNAFWDFSLPISYYFGTEEISTQIKGFENIKSGKGEWSDRLLNLLNQLDEDYIIYMQEDMWLTAAVDAGFFDQLFTLATANNWQQVKLNSSSVFKTEQTDTFIQGFNVSKINNQESGYLMSHQICLWNKKFLQQQLATHEHPWRNERKGTKRLKALNPELFHVDYFSENGQARINVNQPDVRPSAYSTVSHNATLNNAVLPFLAELNTIDHMNSYSAKLSHNHLHQITHDGKPKPMKKDIFKRSKEWLKDHVSLNF